MTTVFSRSNQMRIENPVPGPVRSPDPDAIDARELFRMFFRRWKLILMSGVLAGIATYLLVGLMPPTYTAEAKILLEPNRVNFLAGAEVLETRDPSQQVINSEIAILTSNLLLEDVIRQIGPERVLALAPELQDMAERQQMDGLVWTVRERLTVWGEEESYVIAISFASGDPDLTMDFPNLLAERHLARKIDDRQDTLRQAGVWLEDRLTALGDELAETEERVAAMRTANLLANGGTLENANAQISNLNNQLVEARAERTRAEAQYDQLRQVIETDGAVAAAALVPTTAIDELQARAVELRQLDASWAETVAPDHPRRVPILRELGQIEKEIATEVAQELDSRKANFEVARHSEESLRDTISQMEQRVVEISRGEIAQRKTEREAQTTRQTYEALLSRLTDARTQERLQNAEAKLIERATAPLAPSSPRPKLMAALAGTSMLALVSVLVFLSEMTANTFRTPKEVTDTTGLPVVATLPSARWSSAVACLKHLRKKPDGPFAESIRKLITMVIMRNEFAFSTSITVLSVKPGEGRTTVSLALAEMAARTGRAAIVLDCDFRHAHLVKQLNCQSPKDLADVIAGRCDVGAAICTPKDTPFDVLMCSKPHPDQADQLSTFDLKPIVGHLTEIYDLVILQGPALLSEADALIVAKTSESRLLVIESEKTKRSEVQEGLAMLNQLQIPVDGVVLNKVRRKA